MPEENKLTIEAVEAAVKNLERMIPNVPMPEQKEQEVGGYKLNLIKSDILTGMQMIIRCGDNAYYSPDITSGEVKIIDFPDPQWDNPPPPTPVFLLNYTGYTTIPYILNSVYLCCREQLSPI